jgi:hypothetical protein
MGVFLCFKQTSDSLKDDNDKKTLLIDIKPLHGKNPLMRPDFGYQKIDLDFRQVPLEFIRLPNNDYLFMQIKEDK